MAKIKFTKGELKRQRDALGHYRRYLPTLTLKKQQLQLEVTLQQSLLEEKKGSEKIKLNSCNSWAGLLSDTEIDIHPWLLPKQVITRVKNIAGIEIPIFQRVEFDEPEYDLFLIPAWVDRALEALYQIVSLRKEIEVIEKGIAALRQELRIATQRVNLFEKVRIPEAEENIRLIKIYIGDQMANAVGRSKIAKRKLDQENTFEEAWR